MRKIITCMILGLLSLVSCTEYDEVAMWNKNEDMGSRLAALEELCSQLNTNIVSLQQIVEALQGNDYVTGVVPVVENGETVGYTISFSKSGPVTIYHGKKGENGQNGTTPVIGVEQDTDGLYYWTLDGEWLTASFHRVVFFCKPTSWSVTWTASRRTRSTSTCATLALLTSWATSRASFRSH